MKFEIKEKLSTVFNMLTGDGKPGTVPLARAYAHNDGKRKRPLLDALENGFSAIEVDIWLVNGKLFVAHDLKDIKPGLTLEEIYLKPLLEHIRRNNGRVHPQSAQSMLLMFDIKSYPTATYKALNQLLEKYKEIFTVFVNNAPRESAVTAVISGFRDRTLMESQNVRYAAYDGRLSNRNDKSPAAFMPMISGRWSDYFKWNGNGKMPEAERKKLHEIVSDAHTRGRRIRFWSTPEKDPATRESVWKELVLAKVDYINTDHLPALRGWLLSNDPRPSVPEIKWLEGVDAKNNKPRQLTKCWLRAEGRSHLKQSLIDSKYSSYVSRAFQTLKKKLRL